MSPYQQQVIDAQMQEFDRQAGINRLGIGDAALQAGAFGGGRHGVQMAEYQKGTDMNRALLQGQLLQQGFQQGQGARAADLAAQQGLGTYQQAMGQAQQGYEQAKLDATQIAGKRRTVCTIHTIRFSRSTTSTNSTGSIPDYNSRICTTSSSSKSYVPIFNRCCRRRWNNG